MRIVHIQDTMDAPEAVWIEALCRKMAEAGHGVLLAYSRGKNPSGIPAYRIGDRPTTNAEVRPYEVLSPSLWEKWEKKWEKPLKLLKKKQQRKALYGTGRERSGNRSFRFVSTNLHILKARLFDRAGFGSLLATRRLLVQLESFSPDVVHLHDLHGYCLHLPTLLSWLKAAEIPVIWSMHDCWPFTGHCLFPGCAEGAPLPDGEQRRRSARAASGCRRYMSGCGQCVQKNDYPASLLADRSAQNWQEKCRLTMDLPYLIVAAPSRWMAERVSESFLAEKPCYVLPEGIDTSLYRRCRDEQTISEMYRHFRLNGLMGRRLVVSTAAIWDDRQNVDELIELAQALGDRYLVAVAGLDSEQAASLPEGSIRPLGTGLNRRELCALLSEAEVFVCPSREEAFCYPILQALACETQVVCHSNASFPELVDDSVGRCVPAGDVEAMAEAVRELCDAPCSTEDCRKRAREYQEEIRLKPYQRLYENAYLYGPVFRAGKEESVR